ncbi:hypothetical protein C9374_009008 [Naegleria lovaniensis]|uniref:SWIM-type domain-containing protein n=1 Tax=Naegleria lovaniensis TaxID=51637 RepID=A0AA88KHK4_NAELO|nr:uncharacterized protein C9374_009008 [Naegleria lovaniensis]KAG2377923.1 hypothetical protein C9374_009008 [Naegleria lovaniensis]
MLHHCLDVLYLYIATEKSSVKVFVAILMKYGPIKKEIEARDHDSFKRGVREGLDKMVNHFANVAPVFLAGTKVTADSYDKLVNLRITKRNNDLQIECEKIVMFFCADNKAKQATIGNSIGGHKRCNQCDENFDSVELACYNPDRLTQITFQEVLDRAQLGRKEQNQQKLGLKRVSGCVLAYFSERQKVDVGLFHKYFNQHTRSHCIAQSSVTKYQRALCLYEELSQVTINTQIDNHNILHVATPIAECWFNIDGSNNLVTNFKKCSCTNNQQQKCDTICEHACFVHILLHYNRKNITLEDLALKDVEICSDASHVIPGIFDRLKQKLSDEKGFKLDIFVNNAKKILGHNVSLGMISHSD